MTAVWHRQIVSVAGKVLAFRCTLISAALAASKLTLSFFLWVQFLFLSQFFLFLLHGLCMWIPCLPSGKKRENMCLLCTHSSPACSNSSTTYQSMIASLILVLTSVKSRLMQFFMTRKERIPDYDR